MGRRVLIDIATGNAAAGISALVERARARDARVPVSAETARQERALEWNFIGALAFIVSDARAVEAYERALDFAPSDRETLDQLAWLYGRQAQIANRTAIAERMTRLEAPESRVWGFIHLADIHLDQNDGASTRPFVDQALAIAHDNNLARQEAKALALLAACHLFSRDYDDVEKNVQRSLQLSRANRLPNEEVMALFIQGTAHFARGGSSMFGRNTHLRRAEQSYEQAQAILVAQHDEYAVAQLLVRRGQVARLMGDLPLSEQRLREAMTNSERLGVRARHGFAQGQLGTTLVEQGRFDEAIPLFTSSVEIARQYNQPEYEGIALVEWAKAESRRRHMPDACRLAREAAAAFRRAPGHLQQAGQVGLLAAAFCMG